MIDLFVEETKIGTVTDEDFKALVVLLEEEGLEDRDYYINEATIQMVMEGGNHPHLVELISKALGESEGVEVRWQRVE